VLAGVPGRGSQQPGRHAEVAGARGRLRSTPAAVARVVRSSGLLPLPGSTHPRLDRLDTVETCRLRGPGRRERCPLGMGLLGAERVRRGLLAERRQLGAQVRTRRVSCRPFCEVGRRNHQLQQTPVGNRRAENTADTVVGLQPARAPATAGWASPPRGGAGAGRRRGPGADRRRDPAEAERPWGLPTFGGNLRSSIAQRVGPVHGEVRRPLLSSRVNRAPGGRTVEVHHKNVTKTGTGP
jgi:hypothetical protein